MTAPWVGRHPVAAVALVLPALTLAYAAAAVVAVLTWSAS